MSIISRRQFIAGLGGAAVSTASMPLWAGGAHAIPELVLQGSAGQVGYLHGKSLRSKVEHNVAFYLNWLQRTIRSTRDHVLATAARFAPVLAESCPLLLEEIDGIAKGAGRSRAEILLINARTDLLVMARPRALAAQSARELLQRNPPGCTALALSGTSAGKTRMALGQNWDWRQELANHVVVLRIKRHGGPSLLTFTEAGMVGKIGMNEARLGVCLNFLSHSSESPDHAFGVPIHCLLRLVLESSEMKTAYQRVAWLPRCASANFLLAEHAQDGVRACSLELTPDAVARIDLDRAGELIHTNHFLSPSLAPGCTSGRGRSTMNRHASAAALNARLRALADPVARMKQILRDRTGAPDSVSKSVSADSSSKTLAGIVMDLTQNRLYLAAGNPHEVSFVERPAV
jgi:isopenicillin-N N-acyltransferase-like protein